MIERVLFTADWQAAWSNMDRVNDVAAHLLDLCAKYKVRTVVHCGDIKEVLNPVDQRVTNGVVAIVRRFVDAKIRFVALLGNHDRIANQDTAQNWFPVLSAAGAIAVDSPRVLKIDPLLNLHLLPYSNDLDTVRENATQLSLTASPKTSVLVFHHEVESCKLNAKAPGSTAALTIRDLHPQRYVQCIGGHIHMQQHVGANVWYVGSPFCCEWGEANQRKGFLLLEGRDLRSIRSRQPGYHDPTWPGFTPRKLWDGEYVRVHVPINPGVQDVAAVMLAAKKRAASEYRGAHLVLVPDDTSEAVDAPQLAPDATDEDAIREYVLRSLPEQLQGRGDALASYLLAKVDEVAATSRSRSGVVIKSLEAMNVLSFEKLKINYARPGVWVVSGENRDWGNRSNGSGKTSYLQVLAIALAGRNTKDQQHDAWMRRGIGRGEECWVKCTLELGDGRELQVIRGRKPKGLRLLLEGQDITAGRTEREVQKDLELLTGLTWTVMENALFVDQREINRMLSGTDSERKQIFVQFLNLERFARAQVLVKTELSGTEKQLREAELNAAAYLERADQVTQQLAAWIAPDIGQLQAAVTAKQQVVSRAEERLKQLATPPSTTVERRAVDQAMSACASLATQIDQVKRAIDRHRNAPDTCSQCGAPLDQRQRKTHLETMRTQLEKLQPEYGQAQRKLRAAEATFKQVQDEVDRYREKELQVKQALTAAVYELRMATQALQHGNAMMEQRAQLEGEQIRSKDLAVRFEQSAVSIREEIGFLRHAVACLSKDGLPAYLGAKLLPKLNRAARRYSALFSDNAIGVELRMKDEDIELVVHNEFGGEALRDQSAGETRMASLIVSFALRDVMSPCNLLIADEPGEGLDEINARQFARGLLACTDRFPTILVTTHNAYIMSELSGQWQVLVTKDQGVSSVYVPKKGK